MTKQILTAIQNLQRNVVDLYHKVNNAGTGPQGPMGPQGIQGNPGTPGAVGPAGLNWQGTWVSGNDYSVDDAVGYNGASWFCINDVSGSTESPLDDPTNWALLAAQGSQGIQGVQGPTGPQGPAGTSVGSYGFSMANSSFPYPVMPYTLNIITSSADSPIERIVLPTVSVGNKVVAANVGSYRFYVDAQLFPGGGFYFNGMANSTIQEIVVYPNETYEFTYLGNAEWLCNLISTKPVFYNYVSLLQFISDGTPTNLEIYNNIPGGTAVIRESVGQYQISSASKFTSNKTVILPFGYQGTTTDSGLVRLPLYSNGVIVGYYWLQRITSSIVRLFFVDTSNNPVEPYSIIGSRRITVDIKIYN